MPFIEFKKIYEETHYFKSLSDKERKKELEKAYKVATNGNTKTSTSKREKSEPVSTGEGDIQHSSED